MAIEMVGGVYCPLSHRDPCHRLNELVKQTSSRLIIVHQLTKVLFTSNILFLNLDLLMTNHIVDCDIDMDCLLNAAVTSRHMAYIIFTSGSTGTPKAVYSIECSLHRYRNSIFHRSKLDIKISFNLCILLLISMQ